MTRVNAYGQAIGPELPEWTPRPYPPGVSLTGRYVILEPLGPEHARELYASLCQPGDEALWTYRSTEMPRSEAELAHLLEATASASDLVTYTLIPNGVGPAGLASYARIEPAHGCLEIAAIVFARSLQRTAAATEALHLALRHAFDDLGYRRVEWKCDDLNDPSRAAAARHGFAYEGGFRNHLVVKGRNRDTAWFALTDGDWPAVRAAHQRWLDPANFDGQGRQRVSLSSLTDPLLTPGD